MRFHATITGQSNEQGPGYNVNSVAQTVVHRNLGPGCPAVEVQGPNGGFNTMWPHLAGLMGRRGHWFSMQNTARGTTGIADVWVGRCKTWQTGKVITPGAYRLNGGGIWKATGLAIGSVATTVTGPTGTSNTTLDGITWVYLGVPTARDTDGRVYEESDASRFDPNGLLAGCLALQQAAAGYDVRLHIVSIGQGDKSTEVLRAEYSQAMQSVAAYMTARGIYVLLGMTIYGATAGMDAWYSAELLPGRLDALSALSGNRLVKAGADLRTALGVLSSEAAGGPALLTPALQADNLHGNPPTMRAAADAWDLQMQALGW